jgi:hypothetical protein
VEEQEQYLGGTLESRYGLQQNTKEFEKNQNLDCFKDERNTNEIKGSVFKSQRPYFPEASF